MSRFRDTAELYFPTFVDWRGRIYYRGAWQPQSQDVVRGCLEFAEGKPLGERGLYWLRVHIANCCGFDKAHPDIKVQYCMDNHEFLMRYAADPLNIEAPDPDNAVQLLQAVIAYRDAMQLPDATQYVCHCSIAMDATCSGLQHLSAMIRDNNAGRYVNLTDLNASAKQDIYQEVADKAAEVLGQYTDEVQALYWADKPITRSMAKRPVMTYVYGSTLSSAMDYVRESMEDAGYKAVSEVVDGVEQEVYSLNKLSVCVAKALRTGISMTVPDCELAMRYLQMCCRAMPKGDALRWISPAGMPVVNWAEGAYTKRVNINSMGISQVTFRHYTQEINATKATNSIAPNFVHSMDAAHLCLTLQEFPEALQAIHDSFGCHACNVDALHTAIRQSFVNMYLQEDVIQLLAKFNPEVSHIAKPPKGTLDITQVIDSVYMFS